MQHAVFQTEKYLSMLPGTRPCDVTFGFYGRMFHHALKRLTHAACPVCQATCLVHSLRPAELGPTPALMYSQPTDTQQML